MYFWSLKPKDTPTILALLRSLGASLGLIRWTVWAGLGWAGCVGLGLAGCVGPSQDTDLNVFHYNQETPIRSLDPAMARDQAGNWTARLLYNRLVELGPDQNPVPSLAHRWEILDEGRLYRFHLRDSVFFHENPCFGPAKTRPLRAGDVVYSLQRLQDPSTASPGAWIFRDKLAPQGMTVVDSLTLEIHLSQPFPPLLGLLSMGYCSVTAPEATQRYGRDFRSHPVGTGPFALRTWLEGEGLVLSRHPRYFEKDAQGHRLPYLQAVQIHQWTDKSTAAMAFLQGKIDLLSGWEPAFQRRFFDDDLQLKPDFEGHFQVVRGPYFNTEYLGFLLDSSARGANRALLNPLVRQALHHATDRVTLVRSLRRGVGYPGHGGLLPPGLPGFDSTSLNPKTSNPYQPLLASEILRKAGYGPTHPLRLVLETNPSYADIAQYLQSLWAPLGIQVEIKLSQGPALRQLISGKETSFFRASWIADYADAENYLALAYGPNQVPNGPNYTCYQDSTYDRLYQRALQTTDVQERNALYRRMDARIQEARPLIVLYYDMMLQLLAKGWEGWHVSPLNSPDFRYLRRVPTR